MNCRPSARSLRWIALAGTLTLALACGEKDPAPSAPAPPNPQGAAAAQTAPGEPPTAPAGPGAAVSDSPGGAGPGSPGGKAAPVPVAPSAPRATGGQIAYDLLPNRFLTHLFVAGGLYIPCGDPGFLKYTQGTWKTTWLPLREVDGQKVALTKGIQGVVRFPFDPELCGGACELRFDMKPLRDGQRVSIFVNEKEYPAVETPTGFKTYSLSIKDGQLVAGENTVRFHFRGSGDFEGVKTAAAFRSVAIVPKGSPVLAGVDGAPARVRDLTVGGKSRPALVGTPFGRVDWLVAVPQRAKLLVATGTTAGAAAFAVDVTDGRTGETKRVLTAAGDAGGWREQVVDLAPWADEVVRLSFVTEAEGTAMAGWAEPTIVLPPSPVARPERPVKNVIVWLVDTMRWDALKAYAPTAVTKTPNFDAFIEKGTMFDHFTVQGAHSIPSHASFLTGLYPTAHGHHSDTTKLKPSIQFLGEILQKNKVRTALISSNGYVSTKWGFEQGWDYYKNFIRDSEPAAAWNLFKEVETWLRENYKKRFFLNIVSIDMHVAYRWRDDYCKPYDPEPYTGPVKEAISGNFLNKIREGKVVMTERDKKRMKATYDCNATYNDEYFGKLLALLDRLGIRDETLVVVMSDHGDEFFEHGGVGHGHSLHSELVRVPFFLSLPGTVPEGKRVHVNTEIVDVGPTILDFMGIDPTRTAMHGESLIPLIFSEDPHTPRPAFADQFEVARSMQVGDWKYILKHGDNASLYDITVDPYEQTDIRKEHPIIDRFARDVLAFWVTYDAHWKKSRWGTPNNHSAAFAEEAWK